MADNQKNLTKEERLLILKHLKFYQSLETGQRPPTTAEQKHFVNVCHGQAKPKTEHEIVYSKFIGIYTPKTNDKIFENKNSEWEGKLQRLQEALENNKIKAIRFSKGKSFKNREIDFKREQPLDKFDRKISKSHIPHDKQKKKIQNKDSSIEKIIFTTKASIKSEQEMKKEILEKAKNRSGLTKYYKKRISNSKSDISEYEEGYPKPGWFTDEDWKKMRSQDYADMKKHHRE